MADLVRGGVDREQVRRDAEVFADTKHVPVVAALARHCLALLAELEQAERELTLALNDLETLRTVVADFEARLAKVPAIVEALAKLLQLAEGHNLDAAASDTEFRIIVTARQALAEWERE